jgi:transcriptional regulator with XRE-family HTH domain
MSSKKITIVENFEFVERFREVCGSDQPADVARLLNISYQAAKNYLQGRLPDTNVLRAISEQTPYSIHWLLTGQGSKFVELEAEKKDTDIFSDALRAFVRKECVKVLGELLEKQNQSAEPASKGKVVVLTPDKIKEEKILEENEILSSRQS